ncbi:MAG: PAS domain S-box protein [Bacteroidales bacterium]|nr:PAS domain S-box protein [Bacteroidales bacterium]
MKTNPSKTLFYSILSGLIIIISLAIIFLGYLRFKKEKADIRKEKYHELHTISELKINQLTQWRKERLSEISFFTSNDPYIQFSSDIINGKKNAEFLFRNHLKQIMTHNRYENIFLLNEHNEVLFSVDTGFIFSDSAMLNNYKEVFESGEIIFGDFNYCSHHDNVHFDIASILKISGKIKTALIFRVDPEGYLFPLIRQYPTPSATAETYLVSRIGDSVKYITPLRHRDNSMFNTGFPLSNRDITAVQAVTGYQGKTEGIDYRGISVLADIRKVPDTPWYMISEIDSKEVFSELHKKTFLVAVVALLLILFSLTAMALIHNFRQRQIYKELYLKNSLLRHTQEELKATFYSMGDGVITTDAEGNIVHMNPVAEKLTGWKEVETKGKKLGKVFRTVNEETHEKEEDIAKKVLKEGKTIILSNHINLISRSGSEIPVSDSAAPILTEDGKISGMVLVFSDQSGPRARQKALKESEERFARLFEKAPLGYQSLDRKGILLEVNQAWLEALGYKPEEVVGRWFGDFLLPGSANRFNEFIDESLKEEVVYAEFEITHSSGKQRLFSINGRVGFKDIGNFDRLHCILQDITEKRMLEQRLRESEEKYKRLTENISDVVWATDLDFRTTYVSPAVKKILGEPPAAHIKRTMEEKFPPESLQKIQAILAEEFEKESLPDSNPDRSRQIELEHYRADGSRIWIGINVSFIRDENGKPVGFQGVTRDISELKKNEAALKQQMDNLEKFNRMMVGRESRMIELKQEINDLLEKLNLPKKYTAPGEVEKLNI